MKRFTLFSIMIPLVCMACYAQPAIPIDSLISTLWYRTSCLKSDSIRISTLSQMQPFADSCSNISFTAYNKNEKPELWQDLEENGILKFHKEACDKILNEIQNTVVKEGNVVLWHLYNMGYIVKTPSQCFGIDIKHKAASLFAEHIDFLLITHRHGDHYTTALIDAMERLQKPVVSNFIENGFKINEPQKLAFGEIRILATPVDHNKQLPDFVITYQIDCGAHAGNCVIFHAGDAYDANQINPDQAVNLFIPHVSVGLDIQKVIDKSAPQWILMSHILELGHPVNKWRWSYPFGIEKCRKLKHGNVYLPVWGEKIVWTGL